MDYYYICECGHKARVSPAEAGTSLRCIACDRTNSIPSLSKLLRDTPRHDEPITVAEHVVATPAVVLIVLSAICIVCLVLSIPVDMLILLNGSAAPADPMSREIGDNQQVALRMSWAIVMVIANGVILYGAICMKRLQYFNIAKAAAFLAIVPCLGPCFVIGIPFGIMALSTLNRDEVRDAFKS